MLRESQRRFSCKLAEQFLSKFRTCAAAGCDAVDVHMSCTKCGIAHYCGAGWGWAAAFCPFVRVFVCVNRKIYVVSNPNQWPR